MRKLIAVFMAITTMFCITPVRAEDSVTVINNANMGNVSIRIESFELGTDGRKEPKKIFQDVIPGEKVDQIVDIVNEGEECWIRASLAFDSNSTDVLDEEDVTISSNKWIRKPDGYWYYSEPVGKKESVELLNQIEIPESWTANTQDALIRLKIRADAVQQRHFDPDFASDSPWFGTVIETSVYNYTIEKSTGDKNFAVVFKGGAEGLVNLGADFFENWGTLMPGDSWSDEAKIENRYSEQVKMYFKAESGFDSDLADQINLKI